MIGGIIKLYHCLIFFIFLLFAIRLYSIQVLNRDYASLASRNYVKQDIEFPCRGIIYDRYGRVLAENIISYEIFVSIKDISEEALKSFCKDFNLKDDIKKKILEKIKQKEKQPIFVSRLSQKEWDLLQEKIIFYPFVSIQPKIVRNYRYAHLSHVIGYISEINADDLETKKNLSQNYSQGDLIGVSGLEVSYEELLRGTKGLSYKVVDVYGRVKESYSKEAYDKPSIEGQNITTTIDLDLQEYCAKLLKGKMGCIIALEPKTGEVLALVSSPDYDSNYFTNRNFEKIIEISKSPDRPLYNRVINAKYPPGSHFKLIQSAIGLHLKIINYDSKFKCDQDYIKCHYHPPINNVLMAIQYSCNPYFGFLFKKIIESEVGINKFDSSRLGLEKWVNEVKKFGFGGKIGIDLPYESSGFIPNVNFYDQIHGYKNWKQSTIRSLDIGQGELLITPLQMVNLATIIANRGFYFTPHLVKKTDESPRLFKLNYDKKIFDYLALSMEASASAGCARRSYVPNLNVCAKTGTAQNPHGADHSTTIAFAPRDSPQIAVAVYVENAGWGGRAAAAAAGLVIEYYLNKKISRKYMEEFVLQGNFLY